MLCEVGLFFVFAVDMNCEDKSKGWQTLRKEPPQKGMILL